MDAKRYRIGAAAVASCLLAACAAQPAAGLQGPDIRQDGLSVTAGTDLDMTGETVTGTTSEMMTEEGAGGDEVERKDMKRYQEVRQFSYQLFDEVASGQAENPVISPVSVYIALSMAGAGASGSTQEEFEKVLGEDMIDLSGKLMDMPVSFANAAWIDEEFLIADEWIQTVRSVMGADAFQARLSSADAMESMDRWVSEKTGGLVEKMLEEPLMPDTKLVLFNTLYLKADWKRPFEHDATYEEDFWLSDGTKVRVDMMHKSGGRMDYISDERSEGVILPYAGPGNIALIALKPKDGACRDIRLDSGTIAGLLEGMQVRTVDLRLPKFEITFDKRLNEVLQAMGLNKCFSASEADLTGLGKTIYGDSLYIDLVCQKAKIIVDEKGTEAAAATEVEMKARGASIVRDMIEVSFDRPFFYIIMDMDHKIPLFMGILEDPSAS